MLNLMIKFKDKLIELANSTELLEPCPTRFLQTCSVIHACL